MYLIEIYILRRILMLFFTVFMAAIGLAWTVQILARINFLTTSRQTFLTVLKFSSLFIPSSIQLVLPFALVIAIAQTLSTMNQDSELTIIDAIGSPRLIVYRPVLILGLILSLSSFLVANIVTPYARLNMRKMIAAVHGTLINMFIQEGNFRELNNGIYIEIGERRSDGSIGQLFIVDQRDPNLNLFYYAINGMVKSNQNGNFLVMRKGEVQRRDNRNGHVSIIKFDAYTFDLSEFTPANQLVTVYPKDQFLTYLFNPKSDDPYYQKHPTKYTAELHKRFTEWFYPLVFCLIALAVSRDAYPYRERRISTLFSVLLLSLFVYWLSYFFAEHAESHFFYVPLLYISPLSISLLLGFMLLTNRRVEIPIHWINVFYRFLDMYRNKNNCWYLYTEDKR